jgi:hypothetical protein
VRLVRSTLEDAYLAAVDAPSEPEADAPPAGARRAGAA